MQHKILEDSSMAHKVIIFNHYWQILENSSTLFFEISVFPNVTQTDICKSRPYLITPQKYEIAFTPNLNKTEYVLINFGLMKFP